MPLNPLGVHALVFAGGTTPDEMTAIIDQTSAAGYDILELSLHDSPRLDVAEFARCTAGLTDPSRQPPAVSSNPSPCWPVENRGGGCV